MVVNGIHAVRAIPMRKSSTMTNINVNTAPNTAKIEIFTNISYLVIMLNVKTLV